MSVPEESKEPEKAKTRSSNVGNYSHLNKHFK